MKLRNGGDEISFSSLLDYHIELLTRFRSDGIPRLSVRAIIFANVECHLLEETLATEGGVDAQRAPFRILHNFIAPSIQSESSCLTEP